MAWRIATSSDYSRGQQQQQQCVFIQDCSSNTSVLFSHCRGCRGGHCAAVGLLAALVQLDQLAPRSECSLCALPQGPMCAVCVVDGCSSCQPDHSVACLSVITHVAVGEAGRGGATVEAAALGSGCLRQEGHAARLIRRDTLVTREGASVSQYEVRQDS